MKSPLEYYTILELDPKASLDEVKKSYRDLVQIWHPDRFSTNPRLAKRAENRLKEINLAYSHILDILSSEAKHTPQPEPPRSAPPSPPSQQPSPEDNEKESPNAPSGYTVIALSTALAFILISISIEASRSTPNSPSRPVLSQSSTIKQTPPSDEIPYDLRPLIKCNFPNPISSGTIDNNTDWYITHLTARLKASPDSSYVNSYARHGYNPPLTEEKVFIVTIDSGVIPPHSRGTGRVDIGEFGQIRVDDYGISWPFVVRGNVNSARGYKLSEQGAAANH